MDVHSVKDIYPIENGIYTICISSQSAFDRMYFKSNTLHNDIPKHISIYVYNCVLILLLDSKTFIYSSLIFSYF